MVLLDPITVSAKPMLFDTDYETGNLISGVVDEPSSLASASSSLDIGAQYSTGGVSVMIMITSNANSTRGLDVKMKGNRRMVIRGVSGRGER